MKKRRYELDEGSESTRTKKRKKSNIFAFICCFLIAFIIWAYTMAYGDGPSGAEGSEAESQSSVSV